MHVLQHLSISQIKHWAHREYEKLIILMLVTNHSSTWIGMLVNIFWSYTNFVERGQIRLLKFKNVDDTWKQRY